MPSIQDATGRWRRQHSKELCFTIEGHWTYHCISLQHLQNGHSCLSPLHLLYSWEVRVQIHCILHCQGRWVERDYFQRMLASELQLLHCIPVVCRPLWHPIHPSDRHTLYHILFHCILPLCPLLHWSHSLIEQHRHYCMSPNLYNTKDWLQHMWGRTIQHRIIYYCFDQVRKYIYTCWKNLSWCTRSCNHY